MPPSADGRSPDADATGGAARGDGPSADTDRTAPAAAPAHAPAADDPPATETGHDAADDERRSGRLHARIERVEARTERALDSTLDRFIERFHLGGHVRVARFLLPLLLLALGAVVVSLLNLHRLRNLWLFFFFFFAPGGLEVGIPAGVALGIDPLTIIVSIMYADMVGALFLTWNLDLLYRIPRVGPWLSRLEAKAEEKWDKHERLRDLGLFGLGTYVALPISVSGIIPGIILGNVSGFPRSLVWMAVTAGAAVRVIVFTLVASEIGDALRTWF